MDDFDLKFDLLQSLWLLAASFTVTFLSFSGFMTPFFTAAISFVVLGEQPAIEMFLSAIVVFVGLFIFYQEELKKGIHLST